MGKLRTHEDKRVADLAKETVKKWKNDVAAQKEKPGAAAGTGGAGNAKQSSVATASLSAAAAAKGTSVTGPANAVASGSSAATATTQGTNGAATSSSTANGAGAGKTRDAKSDGIEKYLTGDKVRNGSITLLYNAIVLESTECTSPPHVHSVICIRSNISNNNNPLRNKIP